MVERIQLPMNRSWIPARAAVLALASIFLTGTTLPGFSANKHATFVLDANTGKTLQSTNADAQRYPASLTKMMTLYVVFDMIKAKRLSIDASLVISRRAAAQQPSKLGVKAGTRIPMRDAIRALVTKSANDVAVAIAENLGGSEVKFARYMTWRARQIGMRHTTFKNASGLTTRGQVTTARDMATLGLRLSEDHPGLFRFFRTKYFRYGKKRYRNHNTLLFNYAGTDGIKTGYTRASGFNLVTSVRRGKRHVIAVVLGGKTGRRRDATMRRILRKNIARASTRRTRSKARKPRFVARTSAPKITPNFKPRKIAGLSKAHPVRAETGGRSVKVPSKRTMSGPYQVQVGAHADKSSANRQLREVLQKARDIVGKHAPVTVAFDRANKRWYRARFTGYTRSSATETCASLKRHNIDCIVMAAQ